MNGKIVALAIWRLIVGRIIFMRIKRHVLSDEIVTIMWHERHLLHGTGWILSYRLDWATRTGFLGVTLFEAIGNVPEKLIFARMAAKNDLDEIPF